MSDVCSTPDVDMIFTSEGEPMKSTRTPTSAWLSGDWIWSQSAKFHICNDRGWFESDYQEFSSHVLEETDGESLHHEVHGIGSVILPVKQTCPEQGQRARNGSVKLSNVLHVPDARANLIAARPGVDVHFGPRYSDGSFSIAGLLKHQDTSSNVAFLRENSQEDTPLIKISLTGARPRLRGARSGKIPVHQRFAWPVEEQSRWEPSNPTGYTREGSEVPAHDEETEDEEPKEANPKSSVTPPKTPEPRKSSIKANEAQWDPQNFGEIDFSYSGSTPTRFFPPEAPYGSPPSAGDFQTSSLLANLDRVLEKRGTSPFTVASAEVTFKDKIQTSDAVSAKTSTDDTADQVTGHKEALSDTVSLAEPTTPQQSPIRGRVIASCKSPAKARKDKKDKLKMLASTSAEATSAHKDLKTTKQALAQDASKEQSRIPQYDPPKLGTTDASAPQMKLPSTVKVAKIFGEPSPPQSEAPAIVRSELKPQAKSKLEPPLTAAEKIWLYDSFKSYSNFLESLGFNARNSAERSQGRKILRVMIERVAARIDLDYDDFVEDGLEHDIGSLKM